MDCPISAQYQPALSYLSVQNQQRILRYLAGLAARQYADTTLSAVVTTLNALIRHLPGRRNVVLTDDITQTTTQDISAGVTGRPRKSYAAIGRSSFSSAARGSTSSRY